MKPGVARALRLAIGLGALAFLIGRIDLTLARTTVSRANPGWLLVALGAQLVAKACWVLRWRALLSAVGYPRRGRDVLRWILLGLFFNNFLPTSVGGDVARGYELARSGVPRATAAASVVGDRLVGLLALGIMAVVGGALGALFWPGAAPWYTACVIAVVLVTAIVAILRPAVLDSVGRSGLLRYSGRLAQRLRRLVEATSLLSGRGAAVRRALGLSLGLSLCSALYHWSVGRAVDIQLPLTGYLVIVPAVMLFASLPITVNGLGIREVGFVGLLAQQGVPSAQGAVFALLAFAGTLIFALAGGILFLTGGASRVPSAGEGVR
jgi:uncharacterized protein (TIRG00374 family)